MPSQQRANRPFHEGDREKNPSNILGEQTRVLGFERAVRSMVRRGRGCRLAYSGGDKTTIQNCVLKNSRVVFNVAGNKYRLVVAIHYKADPGIVFIRFCRHARRI